MCSDVFRATLWSVLCYLAVSSAQQTFKQQPPQCPFDSDRPCAPKCCPVGFSVDEDGVCQPSQLEFKPEFYVLYEDYEYDDHPPTRNDSFMEDAGDFDLLIGDPCQFKKYRLEPHVDDSDEFYVIWNGSLLVPFVMSYPFTTSEYCLDTVYVQQTNETVVLPFVCFPEPDQHSQNPVQYILYSTGLIISVPFLIVTMLVYCLIPELRDLHGKTLSCHVMCLAMAFISLATVQLGGRRFNFEFCTAVAFVIQFSFAACFFWLNVMCFDTLWSVSSNIANRNNQGPERKRFLCLPPLNEEGKLTPKSLERKVFLCYSVYAWCLPIILIISSLLMDIIPTVPSSYLKPNFGVDKCWFSTEEAEFTYFYGPVAFLLVLNLLMFLLTAYKVWRAKWPEAVPYRTEPQRFRLCFTLFFIMGINWLIEIISWAVGGPKYIWYVTDVINTLQGVIIFCVFVLEPRVRNLVKQQLWPKVVKVLCKSDSSSLPSKTITTYNPVVQDKPANGV